MREHAEVVRRFAPPLADRMTVCSERHKQFWLRAGADRGPGRGHRTTPV